MTPESGFDDPWVDPPADTLPPPVPEALPEDGISALQPSARFCHRCGAAWDLLTDQCTRCSVEFSKSIPLMKPGRGVRLTKLALSLYFVFLVTSLGLILSQSTTVVGLLTADVINTCMVLVWTVAFWSGIRPILATFAPPVFNLLGVAMGMMTFGIASLCLYGLTTWFGIPQIYFKEHFLREGYGWGVLVLSLCVQPAVVEEIAFRGVIFSAMETVISPRDAVWVSALLFMIIHLAMASFPHLLILGLVLGWLRLRTGSLYPGMILHFTHNLLCILTEPG